MLTVHSVNYLPLFASESTDILPTGRTGKLIP